MAIPCLEDRDDPRFNHHSPLQIIDQSFGEIYEARIQNYSNGGIYFESDAFFQKGAKIYICMQSSLELLKENQRAVPKISAQLASS